ncbi:Secreted protein containing C-terminal beta-propeller domain [Paenibacillus sp. 1_12]|uniref:beta-propeller domain-containing protein n=1 Tax=Paenibacillus sp. 1_12 TaxID=1566278 RepID=UPI0008E19E5D|nr:beta-propeller domain-containing protein [Paenibacillus sp. 1_12]SFL26691.1 Secreted protein containing C-terminal beta-propeller domain [Paenibacillus sp. 1_12]
MKKAIVLACLLATTVISFGVSAPPAASESGTAIGLNVNGSHVSFSSMPLLIDNTLMVPLRDLSESLGVQIDWDGSSQTAAAIKGTHSIKLTIDSKQAFRGETPVNLEAAPRLQNGKLFVPLRFFSESFDFNVYWDGLNKSVAIVDADKSLPTIGSADQMQELFKDYAAGGGGIYGTTDTMMTKSVMPVFTGVQEQSNTIERSSSSASVSAPAPQAAAAESKADYSATNVQIEGVDEADIIKTDGTYIYQVNRNRVIIANAYPADQMKVTQTLTFEDKNFRAKELYIDDKHMVVIGTTFYRNIDPVVPVDKQVAPTASVSTPVQQSTVSSSSAAAPPLSVSPVPILVPTENIKIISLPGVNLSRSTTKAIVYELGDRTQVKKLREVELDGNYVSSRKVGSSLYLVSNKGFNIYPLLRGDISSTNKAEALKSSAPAYRDSAAGDAFISIGYEDIRYFPKSVQPNYLLIGGFNLDQPEQKLNVSSYLGSGQQVYASQSNLFVTTNEYTPAVEQTNTDDEPLAKRRITAGETSSVIYKFAMDQGSIRYTGRGKVPGRVINQFAMDEMNGSFRIATTTGFAGLDDEMTSKNHMYVLNESMNVVGQINDIAPGEQIYSVRYAGNRAYMVTFKTVDPLFVIDLQEPQAPKILGKLKIPGYSNYLHPYDDTHLIGFGKDAVEVSTNNGSNGSTQTNAYYQGMKMAMFDVSDVANPKELFSESIGDRGTDSELLRNHKALLFSKEKNLLAFPVTLMETKNNAPSTTNPTASVNNIPRYGDFTFQGAYVYQIDVANGFQLKGKITHLTNDDYLKSGQFSYNGQRNIQRILYIGDALYTSSEQILKATDITSMNDLKSITLP